MQPQNRAAVVGATAAQEDKSATSTILPQNGFGGKSKAGPGPSDPRTLRAVRRYLEMREGEEYKATAKEAVADLRLQGVRLDTRRFRAIVKELRRSPHHIPIASSSADGGYWHEPNPNNFRECMQREIMSRISDLSETLSDMQITLRRLGGNSQTTFAGWDV